VCVCVCVFAGCFSFALTLFCIELQYPENDFRVFEKNCGVFSG
jgi:hypothetical protein